MNLERYEVIKSIDHFEYEFYSEGSKGRIRKLVRFQPFSNDAGEFFNLVFGDLDEDEAGMFIDDSVISNNEDADKILATIAHIALHFTNMFPNAEIYAEGSTASRNRLYRMAINRRLKDIKKLFTICGVTEDNEIEPFIRIKNYIGFVVKRKSY
ncbi:MAG TPA: hypothetical protein VL727_17880 [Puia sp.]|nr:hypothetical protein [Puia sp.]